MGELIHMRCADWLRKRHNKIVVQIFHAILSYLLEVGRGGLDEVHGWQVRDAFSSLVDVLVKEDVAIAERAYVHDRCNDVLTIRVKNEGLEGKEGAWDKAAISHLDLLIVV